MNYSRGLQPSCCSKAEYENENRKSWFNVKTKTPAEGMPVVILQMNGVYDPEAWTTDIAYFCDGSFYNLQLDPILGVLRKEHVSEPVEYWTQYITPCAAELKEGAV